MHRLEELAQAAVGYDAKRGDQVVIENMSFSGNAPEPPAPILDRVTDGAKGFLRTQPNLLRTVMIGLCGLLLVMFVLKPVGQQVLETLKEPVMLAPGARPLGSLEAGGAGGAVSGETTVKHIGSGSEPPGTITTSLAEGMPGKRKSKNSPQAIFDAITENIKTDPAQSTRLLQGWIAAPETELDA
jgi:flagellar M-ring protein FliF